MSTQQTPSEAESNASASTNPFPLRVRIIQLVFLTIAVLTTLGLAYWQWTSWQSSGGSFQNLGYAIQWPIFGGFLIFAYRKYIRYEKERLRGEEEAAVPQERKQAMTEIPDDFLHDLHQAPRREVDVSRQDLEDDRRRRARGGVAPKKEGKK
ncbi:MAG TPA: hypothetical protein H9867_05940 [Candidatus Corynebacterium gallistercoris]|uniref:DNA-binding transcriptional regulator of glucitol operon n=1 Tax=Candidatus Corynebacterium gallistercoris TaxID=2838530 RepID=A0A9D1RYL3_9CORY|nr:hypothetical protein [Candidatus Corynebacterium gallistercoris]